jgi:3-phenylpropionate/trans-cinnamate dioxygenase ferredoxin subunit
VKHHVCDLDDIAAGSARRVDVGGRSIALIRIGDDVYALGDRCTHEDVSLSDGEVVGRELECWKHGSTFSVDTGAPQCLPATEPTPTYDVNVVDGQVYVSIDGS